MTSNGSGCHPRKNFSRQALGPRAYLVLIMVAVRGLLLPGLVSEAKVKSVSLVDFVISTPHNSTRSEEIVSKTVVSSKLRMSVLVGLEGSGHHYLGQAISDMFNSNDEISETTTPCVDIGAYYTKISMKSSPHAYSYLCKHAREDMQNLALQEQSLPWPGHLTHLCREQSYPSGNGQNKVVHYIDLRMLAEIAEEEGVDIRVVYLKRSAHDLLVANTVHRGFQETIGLDVNTTTADQRFTEYSLILLTNAAVMHSFLSEIDPAFVVCHDYAHAGEEEQATTVSNFVAPNSVMAEMFKTSLLRAWTEHSSQWEELSFDGAEAVASRLQRKLDAFESLYCG